MNCPKCKSTIAENDLICPTCKKVIRLKCQVCGAITKNSVCEKCGTVLLNKCYKCGKLNNTTVEKCPACGLDVNASIGLKESIIEEFAALTIEVTNFEDIKSAFKSQKITDNFKNNFYTMIKKAAAHQKHRVQFINDTFVIRFCKDYSFLESCKSALDFAIYITQTVKDINRKLFSAKGLELKLQMAIQKRDVYAKPTENKSGVNMNVVYSSSVKWHLFNNIEVVVYSYIYQSTKESYPYQSLSAVYVKNQMVMFFELILEKLIAEEKEEKFDINNVKLPKNIDFEPEEDAEDANLINFTSLNCNFVKAKNETLLNEISKAVQATTNPIISVRSEKKCSKLTGISNEDLQNIYTDYQIIRFSASQNDSYNTYGLFKQIIYTYYGQDELSVNTTPEVIDTFIVDEIIKELFRKDIKENIHPEDIRINYLEAFTDFINSIPAKTLFVIEDLENADESSLEILKYLFENNKLSNISLLVSYDTTYSLHRKMYKLMTNPSYTEIELKRSSNKQIIAKYYSKIQDVKDSFFYEKILENTKGSYSYFEEALNYLEDDDIFEIKNKKYKVKQDRMIVLPHAIDELVQKRITHLNVMENAFEIFGSILLIGEYVPFGFIHQLGIKNDAKILKYLEERKLIAIHNDNIIKVLKYNLFAENFLKVCEEDKLVDITKTLLEKIYINEKLPNPNKAKLLEIAKLKKEAFSQWHSLAMISSQSGDFCAYLNCTNKFLSLVDNVIDSDTDEKVEKIKFDVYAELASLLYKYYPDKILKFLQMILTNFEEQNDNEKVKEIANKLVQSCLMSGNYNNALEYMGKIISRTPKSTFNPSDPNFSYDYFLMNLVTLEIYFNLGRLNECIELGEELFRNIDIATFTTQNVPDGFAQKQFEDVIYEALFFIATSKIIQIKPDRKEYIDNINIKTENKYTTFTLLKLLIELFEGKDIIQDLKNVVQGGLTDKYSFVIFPILQ